LLLTVGLLIAADDPMDDIQKEMKKLQGSWTPVSVESGGMKATGDDLKKVAGKLEIDGDKITMEVWSTPMKATLKIDPTKKPKSMDFVHEKNKMAGLAIYELDGELLRICFQVEDGKPRPEEFTSKDAFVISADKLAKP
jgi:uncharacterized protein (TIGR03067 family)